MRMVQGTMDRLKLLLSASKNCTGRSNRQQAIHWQGTQRGQLVLSVIICLFGMIGCASSTLPTPTAIPPQAPLSSPVAPIATPTTPPTTLPTVRPTATAVSQSVLSVLPTTTLSATAAALPSTTITVASPLTVTVAMTPTISLAVDVVTATTVLTSAVESDLSSTVAAVGDLSDCVTDVDIALAAYPDLHTYLGCAQAPASFEPVAINEFGVGPTYDRFMLWFGSENQIYVLLPSKEWQRYADTWTEEQATFACNPLADEPASPPLPRRGFGKIWCEVEGLQAVMGMVEREERLCQHTVTQRFELGRLLACYEDATIRFFRIMNDGTWDQMLTQ